MALYKYVGIPFGIPFLIDILVEFIIKHYSYLYSDRTQTEINTRFLDARRDYIV